MTYFADSGPKVNWFCVYWTDCLCAIGLEGWGGLVGLQGRVAVKVGSHQSMQWYFHFVYLSWRRRRSTPQDFVLFVCCELTHRSKVHSFSDNHKQNTHIHTHSSGHCAPPLPPPPSVYTPCIEARVFPPAREASSCSTYTHSFPSLPKSRPPTTTSSLLIPSDWPPRSPAFSQRLSRTSFSSVSPVWIPLIGL